MISCCKMCCRCHLRRSCCCCSELPLKNSLILKKTFGYKQTELLDPSTSVPQGTSQSPETRRQEFGFEAVLSHLRQLKPIRAFSVVPFNSYRWERSGKPARFAEVCERIVLRARGAARSRNRV